MFDIGWGELLVIGGVALIAIGPKELPGVLRTTGQWMDKISHKRSSRSQPAQITSLGFWLWLTVAILLMLVLATASVKFGVWS
jgi:hypothetical protein